MNKVETIGPLFIDGKKVYPETLTEAVKDRKGNKLSDIIERIQELGIDEIEQLREYVMDAVVWDDSVIETIKNDKVIRDADTLGGIYKASHIKELYSKITQLQTLVQELQSNIDELNNKVNRLEQSDDNS